MLRVKALHLFFMTSWFAGIFYLPRLFVYHAMTEESASREHLQVMARRLYRFVTPMMWITLVLGFWMLYEYAWAAFSSMLWLHLKLALVVTLVAYHFNCAG